MPCAKPWGRFYPDLDTMRLVDFKVRVIDGRAGTAPPRCGCLSNPATTMTSGPPSGVSEDIIEASWQALADSFQYKLAKAGDKDATRDDAVARIKRVSV